MIRRMLMDIGLMAIIMTGIAIGLAKLSDRPFQPYLIPVILFLVVRVGWNVRRSRRVPAD
jgi:hypothetical protein